jgi:hypothetical protein
MLKEGLRNRECKIRTTLTAFFGGKDLIRHEFVPEKQSS